MPDVLDLVDSLGPRDEFGFASDRPHSPDAGHGVLDEGTGRNPERPGQVNE